MFQFFELEGFLKVIVSPLFHRSTPVSIDPNAVITMTTGGGFKERAFAGFQAVRRVLSSEVGHDELRPRLQSFDGVVEIREWKNLVAFGRKSSVTI